MANVPFERVRQVCRFRETYKAAIAGEGGITRHQLSPAQPHFLPRSFFYWKREWDEVADASGFKGAVAKWKSRTLPGQNVPASVLVILRGEVAYRSAEEHMYQAQMVTGSVLRSCS